MSIPPSPTTASTGRGMRQLRGDGGGNSETHAGEAVRHEERPGLIAAPELAHD